MKQMGHRRLQIFNPEHDLALAANLKRFTPPRVAARLRKDIDFLPAIWAGSGDFVLVEDVGYAEECIKELGLYNADFQFISEECLKNYDNTEKLVVEPWGWDLSLLEQLDRIGRERLCYPTEQDVAHLRLMSSREWCAHRVLPLVVALDRRLVGGAFVTSEEEEIGRLVETLGRCVLKSPWSCSGRGVKYVLSADDWSRHQLWVRQTLQRQGSMAIEPYYNKVVDFAMEFLADAEGKVRYEGLSVFSAIHGNYQGNMVAPEETKREQLGRYIPLELLDTVSEGLSSILGEAFLSGYEGPLGVDMMVVEQESGFVVHPCVEVNLRRTMGHVALALWEKMGQKVHFFQIQTPKAADERVKMKFF